MNSTDSSSAIFFEGTTNDATSGWLPCAVIMRPALECNISRTSPVSCLVRFCCVRTGRVCKEWSALIDYAEDKRLHQYHFDRWQWTTVTAAQSLAIDFERTLSFTLSENMVWSRIHGQCSCCGFRYCEANGATELVLDFCPCKTDMSTACGN